MPSLMRLKHAYIQHKMIHPKTIHVTNIVVLLRLIILYLIREWTSLLQEGVTHFEILADFI